MIKNSIENLPLIKDNKKVLIVGANGDIGFETLKLFSRSNITIGAHYHKNLSRIKKFVLDNKGGSEIKLFQSDLTKKNSNQKLIDEFVAFAGGIDIMIQLSGGISKPIIWSELTEDDWNYDIYLNLTSPFLLSQIAMKNMIQENKKETKKIILTSTASALHGGGAKSIGYGIAKAGIIYLTKGLARIGAPYNILVNTISPGLINTKAHTTWMKRSKKELEERAKLVPLKRIGTPEEVAVMILFLASDWSNFITGECFTISGGDWL